MDAERGAYLFGEFGFDPSSGELKNTSSGTVTARLQPQVASLLTALLERPGAVVSRAELQARLWPDTTVDFDDSLNFCVRQLRLALGDDASSPKFVETLARRGYRFIAPVSRASITPTPVAKPVASQQPTGNRMLGLTLVALLLVAGILAIGRVMTASEPVRTGAVLAVVPFMFDGKDSTMIAYQRQLFDQVKAGVTDPRSWDLVADTNAATHVLSGALRRRGFSVEVFVQLVRRSNHRHLWADSILDSYAFSGNSTLTGDRIARSVIRLLRSDTTATRP